MQDVCRSENARDPSRFTDRVLAAAQLYFKRFFLVVSPMEESPLAVMLAALYLAGKVEEERVELDRLIELSGLKLTSEVLLAQEMRLLEKLHFQLLTRSPFRCLAGLEQDLHAALAGVPDGSATALAELPELRVATRAALKRALCADTPLLFSPLHMALAALLEANRARPVPIDVAAWMHKQFGDEVGAVAGALEGPGAGSSLVELLQRLESTTASSLSSRPCRPSGEAAARRGGRGAAGGARSEPRQAGSIGIPQSCSFENWFAAKCSRRSSHTNSTTPTTCNVSAGRDREITD